MIFLLKWGVPNGQVGSALLFWDKQQAICRCQTKGCIFSEHWQAAKKLVAASNLSVNGREFLSVKRWRDGGMQRNKNMCQHTRWALVVNGVIYNLCIAKSNSHTGTLKLDGSWKIFSLGFAILEVFFLMNRSFFSRHSHGPPKCCFVDLFLQSWKLTYPTGRKRSTYILCSA